MNWTMYLLILGRALEAVKEAMDGDAEPGDVDFSVRHKSLPEGMRLDCSISAALVEDK